MYTFKALTILALVGGSTVMAADIEENRTLTQAIGEATSINIDVGAGSLEIKGVEGLSEVDVTAYLEVNEGEYELTLKESGGVIELFSRTESNNSMWSDSTKIDLVVRVPSNLELNVIDGSGSTRIENIAADVTVKDGSGSLDVSEIVGNLAIDDGSGTCRVEAVTGNLVVDDGSGSLVIVNIDGMVKVDDGSGSLTISNVTGMVEVDDGSGSMSLTDLESGVDIIDAGSGGVSMTRVKGRKDR